MIKRYGTDIPRIKEACDAAGTTFEFKQAANPTVVRFDLSGGRNAINNGDRPKTAASSSAENPNNTDNKQAVAMKIATEQGKVTTKMPVNSLWIGRLTASRTLRKLAEANMLEWVGKSPNDPHRLHRIKKDSPEE